MLAKQVVQGGFVTACKARNRGNKEIEVSHLLFVDDTLIFCKASQDPLVSLDKLEKQEIILSLKMRSGPFKRAFLYLLW